MDRVGTDALGCPGGARLCWLLFLILGGAAIEGLFHPVRVSLKKGGL